MGLVGLNSQAWHTTWSQEKGSDSVILIEGAGTMQRMASWVRGAKAEGSKSLK